ncbi:MAG TPA: diguanylate cyclase [Burkholderiaceae bacterium]|jgi:diguanylate cyclase (GGDEF)-like protein/PAS domain S-box-containing protein
MKKTSTDGSTHSLDHLYAEQVKLLYKNAPIAYVVTVINGAILIYIQSPYISRSILSMWYGSLLLLTAGRAFVSFRYAKMNCRPEDAKFWNKIYCIGAGLAGCVWGSAALLLFPMDRAHQVFVAFVLAGMSAGGVSVLAPRIEACLAFLLPALLPLFFQYITLRTPLQTAMGIMTLLFFIGIIFSALNFHRVIKTSLSLRFDKQELEAEIAMRNQVEERLYQEKDRLQATLSSIGEGVVMIDAEGRINYMNSAAEQLSGWGHHAAQNRLASEVFESIDNQNQRTTTAMEDSLHTAQQVRKQCTLFCNSDKRYVVEELATPLYDRHSNVVGVVSVFRDMTEAQKKTDELAYAADHDALTGLPNRNLLKDRTRRAIARAQRKHENFALLFLDLDRFKEVNDRMGHASGDALLIDVAKRLTGCVREEDTIARLGGDEFVVLLDGPTQVAQVKTVADKILKSLRKPYQLSKQSINVTVSIGSSLYPNDGQSVESLLEHADTAMYSAKKQGRDRLNIYAA